MRRPHGRRETEKLIQRFQGGADLEEQREYHRRADNDQQQINADITGNGTVRMAPGNQMLFGYLNLFAAQFRKAVQLIAAGPVCHRLVSPVLVNLAVDLQAVIQIENIAAVILQDNRYLAADSAPADVVEPVHAGVFPFNQRSILSLFIKCSPAFSGNHVTFIFLAGDGFHNSVGSYGILFTHVRFPPFQAIRQLLFCTES